ncbi:MAG: hypothetical protein HN725_06570 [Alphaproteobacteria bacterium]|nr:hypothetical protein [Alphaproteobacteria bacterium]MBT4084690.1 hypothetical protein [Alphaproteobacteria bacterium]MBT4544646.1 hypothetical protein [Alphaproteobacteria bacterium]MBT5920330.1 hypothetical protein [Alphaproteobacteria bacterium]MBT7744940.1 hypothetical protein [Alphaproteobacteria bacterium]
MCDRYPIERNVQQELKRCIHKVRIFPNNRSLERLVSAVLFEVDGKWQFKLVDCTKVKFQNILLLNPFLSLNFLAGGVLK